MTDKQCINYHIVIFVAFLTLFIFIHSWLMQWLLTMFRPYDIHFISESLVN